MRNGSLSLMLVAVLTIAMAAPVFAAGRKRKKSNPPRPPAPPPASVLTTAEADAIIHMREEEKLARDVYLTLLKKWDVQIYANISAAEQRHMNALGGLIAKYGLKDPVTDDTVGKFTSPVFADLYVMLVEAGSVSLADALSVGAMIEDMDIFDLQEALKTTDKADLEMVFGNLMRGSRNHLRAFTSQLAVLGETYDPQFLTQEEFDDITGSAMEPGGPQGGRGRGRGMGGRGNGQGGRGMGRRGGRR